MTAHFGNEIVVCDTGILDCDIEILACVAVIPTKVASWLGPTRIGYGCYVGRCLEEGSFDDDNLVLYLSGCSALR